MFRSFASQLARVYEGRSATCPAGVCGSAIVPTCASPASAFAPTLTLHIPPRRSQARRYRAIASNSGDRAHFRSRTNKNFSSRYPAIVEALSAMQDETVIDDEIVMLDEFGRPCWLAV